MDKRFSPDRIELIAIRLRQLGDVLATLGVLETIKKSGRARTIAFMVDRHYHDLLTSLDYIDILLPQPPAVKGANSLLRFMHYIEDIRGLRAKWVLDFHSNPRSALITLLSGVPVRIGFDVRVRKWAYTDIEPRAVCQNGRLIPRTSQESAFALARRIGVTGRSPRQLSEIRLSEQNIFEGEKALLSIGVDAGALKDRKVIGLNPGCPYPSKAWPDAYFIDLAQKLVGRGYQVVFLWGPGELEKVRSIQECCGKETFLAPPLSLSLLAGFLKNLSLVVTIDSGLKHLAASIRVPTVTIFGPTSPFEWHMGGDLDAHVYNALSCSPCRLLQCPFDAPCMTRIVPDAVMERIEHVIRCMGEKQWT